MVPTNELEGFSRKSRGLKIALPVLAVIVVAILLLLPAREQSIPDFELRLLRGGRLSSEELAGRPVVINFWASWCSPCRDEARLLERTYQSYKDEGVVFLGVNIRDTDERARRFVADYGITFPVVRDPEEELADGLGVFGLPQTFFVTRDWKLSSSEAGTKVGDAQGTPTLGAIDARALRNGVEGLLADGS